MTALVAPGARLVCAATGEVLAGEALFARVEATAGGYRTAPPGLVLARTGLTLPAVLRYLGAWCAGRPVALLDAGLRPAQLADLVHRYRPAVVTGVAEAGPAPGSAPGPTPEGYRAVVLRALGPSWVRCAAGAVEPHPELALLLATSGSTGDPKLVRLPRRAVLANARGIAASLRIGPDESAPTCLPLHYSYGLSVLNSHLIAGATVVVVDGGILSRRFWTAVDRYRATSLSGVPQHYETLDRLGWRPARNPSIRVLTQAGGALRPALIRAFHDRISVAGGRLYVMWGQTEAAPRMSVLAPEHLPDKAGSVGGALPGGRLSVRLDDGTETTAQGVRGEVVYRGPNVMYGYAHRARDLAGADELRGTLRTGDLGNLDADGCLWLNGRLSRIGKVFGVRLDLDRVEDALREWGPAAALAADDRVVVFCAGLDRADRVSVARWLAGRLRLHRSGFDVRTIDRLPLLSSGKVDYPALEARCDDHRD